MKTLTRRSLLGGTALTIGGAGALAVGESHRGRRWLHSAGVVDGPDAPVPDVEVRVERHTLASALVGGNVQWSLAAPPVTAEALVLCLHGRGGSHASAFDSIGVHRFVAAARLPWAVVGVDGGSSYWHRRADGTDTQAMVFEELLPATRRRVGDVPLVVLGWSMGGYGALLAATGHGDRVKAVAAASPALWTAFSRTAGGAFDSAADFAAHDVFRRLPALEAVPVRLDCGDDDPFAGTVRDLARRLPHAESRFGPGFHDAAFWRSRVAGQLAFFGRALDR